MTYLQFQGEDPEKVCYDLKYALRLCTEHGHQRACVFIYTTMGLHEEAVDLALKVDVELAKVSADRPEADEPLRKKLWLRIARCVVEQEGDIGATMRFLRECDLIKVEDVLPFFPDFVTIDHFKDAICASLGAYNRHIEALRCEMDEAAAAAREARADAQAFRDRYALVRGADKCAACAYPILTRAFYLFPCRHAFHADCLLAELRPYLSATKRQRVDDLSSRLSTNREPETGSTGSPAASGALQTRQDHVKAELDELLADECLYCGNRMIRSISKPFIEAEGYESEMQSWV
ncbi:PREDICTED: vacuolar protein sorting-associated protein 18 homolog [Priapulus caudatus]|uniref:Vacuolar protein sorting-associated protein 18 homolog n=1 Tax=Priapulus caudatus TaxID=37621 RepID=A0ABM1EH98_PRICU|nr:PREDICTED: vacuolar protein sorting-associated protein 18 homolog [Priapulus caudatus]